MESVCERPLMTRTELEARCLTQFSWENENFSFGRSPRWQWARLAALFIKNKTDLKNCTFEVGGAGGGAGEGGGAVTKAHFVGLGASGVFTPFWKTQSLFEPFFELWPNCGQTPADISFQIENDELLTKNWKIYRIVQSIEGVSPYRAPKRYRKDGWYDK